MFQNVFYQMVSKSHVPKLDSGGEGLVFLYCLRPNTLPVFTALTKGKLMFKFVTNQSLIHIMILSFWVLEAKRHTDIAICSIRKMVVIIIAFQRLKWLSPNFDSKLHMDGVAHVYIRLFEHSVFEAEELLHAQILKRS